MVDESSGKGDNLTYASGNFKAAGTKTELPGAEMQYGSKSQGGTDYKPNDTYLFVGGYRPKRGNGPDEAEVYSLSGAETQRIAGLRQAMMDAKDAWGSAKGKEKKEYGKAFHAKSEAYASALKSLSGDKVYVKKDSGVSEGQAYEEAKVLFNKFPDKKGLSNLFGLLNETRKVWEFKINEGAVPGTYQVNVTTDPLPGQKATATTPEIPDQQETIDGIKDGAAKAAEKYASWRANNKYEDRVNAITESARSLEDTVRTAKTWDGLPSRLKEANPKEDNLKPASDGVDSAGPLQAGKGEPYVPKEKLRQGVLGGNALADVLKEKGYEPRQSDDVKHELEEGTQKFMEEEFGATKEKKDYMAWVGREGEKARDLEPGRKFNNYAAKLKERDIGAGLDKIARGEGYKLPPENPDKEAGQGTEDYSSLIRKVQEYRRDLATSEKALEEIRQRFDLSGGGENAKNGFEEEYLRKEEQLRNKYGLKERDVEFGNMAEMLAGLYQVKEEQQKTGYPIGAGLEGQIKHWEEQLKDHFDERGEKYISSLRGSSGKDYLDKEGKAAIEEAKKDWGASAKTLNDQKEAFSSKDYYQKAPAFASLTDEAKTLPASEYEKIKEQDVSRSNSLSNIREIWTRQKKDLTDQTKENHSASATEANAAGPAPTATAA